MPRATMKSAKPCSELGSFLNLRAAPHSTLFANRFELAYAFSRQIGLAFCK